MKNDHVVVLKMLLLFDGALSVQLFLVDFFVRDEVDKVVEVGFDDVTGPREDQEKALLIGGWMKALKFGNLLEEFVEGIFEVGVRVGLGIEKLVGGTQLRGVDVGRSGGEEGYDAKECEEGRSRRVAREGKHDEDLGGSVMQGEERKNGIGKEREE